MVNALWNPGHGYETGTNANPLVLSLEDIEVFWSKVEVSTQGTCWNWLSQRSKFGYGVFSRGTPPNRMRYFAHRVAYYLHVGEDPGKYLVCHRCDNPLCVNPAHLFLGTCGDNHRDAIAKGRKVSPQKGRVLCENATALFADYAPYWEIWAMVQEGYYKSFVGRLYGISPQAVNSVLHSIKKLLLESKDLRYES